jgi:hypothetical protein
MPLMCWLGVLLLLAGEAGAAHAEAAGLVGAVAPLPLPRTSAASVGPLMSGIEPVRRLAVCAAWMRSPALISPAALLLAPADASGSNPGASSRTTSLPTAQTRGADARRDLLGTGSPWTSWYRRALCTAARYFSGGHAGGAHAGSGAAGPLVPLLLAERVSAAAVALGVTGVLWKLLLWFRLKRSVRSRFAEVLAGMLGFAE